MSEDQNRPRGRKRNITGQAQEIRKEEQDLGTGPVGTTNAPPSQPVQPPASSQNAQRPFGQQAAASQNAGRPAQQSPQQSAQNSFGRQNSAGSPFGRQSSQSPFGQQRPAQPNAQQPMGQQNAASQRPQQPAGQQQSAQRPMQQSAQRPVNQQQAAQQRPVVHQSPQRPASQQQSAQRPSGQQQNAQRASATGGSKAGASRGGCLPLIILLVVVLLGGGAGLSGMLGNLGGLLGGGDTSVSTSVGNNSQDASSLLGDLLNGGGSGTGSSGTQNASSLVNNLLSVGSSGNSAGSNLSLGSGSIIQSLMGSGSWYSMLGGADSSVSTSGVRTDSTALNTRVAAGSREKYTAIKGSGKDKVTILVYMCGADLESRSGMATKDLQEMLSASFGSKVNLIVYTGGASQWRNNQISSRVNQIWQIKNKKLSCLEENMGTASMTSPDTLLSFLEYGAKNFKADRYQLILWDHGCGSVTGYGHDEKNPNAGSMSLAGINKALKASNLKFDFIGFDACLMATVENALMLSDYADYLIASEESEPGIGWYYTNWLTQLGENTSVSTLELGKTICDDFTSACKKACPGQATTLSVVDLAELEHTVPEKLAAFSRSMTGLIEGKEYSTVSNARNGSREFAASSRTDMVDLTDLATKLGNDEGSALAGVLKSAVKYNRSTIADAYGLSIFFPYKKVSNVDKAVSTYAAIGLDDSYSEAIRAFASVESSGQAVSSQNGYQIPSILTGGGSSSSWSSGAYGSSDMISSLLSGFLGGDSDLDFLSGRQSDTESLTEYFMSNMFDPSNLVFTDGVLRLPAGQWALVHSIEQNIFYDDGSGYIDLGLDNVYDWNENGDLVADTSGAWLGLNGQITPYYSLGAVDDGENWYATGYIPVLLNGWRAELLVTFDGTDAGGVISGARWVYADDETETVAKAVTELEPEDQIQLICDYYDYEGNYQSSHVLGETITVGDGLTLTDLLLPDASKANITYRLTDIYNQAYWTAPL